MVPSETLEISDITIFKSEPQENSQYEPAPQTMEQHYVPKPPPSSDGSDIVVRYKESDFDVPLTSDYATINEIAMVKERTGKFLKVEHTSKGKQIEWLAKYRSTVLWTDLHLFQKVQHLLLGVDANGDGLEGLLVLLQSLLLQQCLQRVWFFFHPYI